MSLVAAILNDSLFGDIGSHRTCYRRQQRPQPPMTGNAYPTTDNWTIAVSAAVEVTSYEHGWYCCRSYPLFHQLPALRRLHHGKKHITFQKMKTNSFLKSSAFNGHLAVDLKKTMVPNQDQSSKHTNISISPKKCKLTCVIRRIVQFHFMVVQIRPHDVPRRSQHTVHLLMMPTVWMLLVLMMLLMIGCLRWSVTIFITRMMTGWSSSATFF